MFKKIIASVFLFFGFQTSFAITTFDLSLLVGYQIIHSGYITGYQDANQAAKTDGTFEGCRYDRVIFIDDRFAVYCRNDMYSYGYRPQMVILSNGADAKMIVNDLMFDISLRKR